VHCELRVDIHSHRLFTQQNMQQMLVIAYCCSPQNSAADAVCVVSCLCSTTLLAMHDIHVGTEDFPNGLSSSPM
jgi:hypothetical protein